MKMRSRLVAAIGLMLVVLAVIVPSAPAQQVPNTYFDNFEFPDMRKTLTWIDEPGWYWYGGEPVNLLPGEIPNQPAGLKTGLAVVYGQQDKAVYINDPSICRGNWCIKVDVPANVNGVNGSDRMVIPSDGTGAISQAHHLFIRALYKFPVGHVFTFGKFLYSKDQSLGGQIIIVPSCTAPCTTVGMNFEATNPSANYYCNVATCQMTGDNQWHALEVEIFDGGGGANQGTLRMWIDEVLTAEYCPTCGAQMTTAQMRPSTLVRWGEYLNGTCCNGAPNSPPTAQVYYLDDLAMSTQRIGAYSAGVSPAITSPAPGSTLTGTSVPFQWTANDATVTEWWLYVGSSAGALDVYDSGSLGTALSTTVTGLPTDGRPLFVRLWYRLGGQWQFSDFQYTASGGAPPDTLAPAAPSNLQVAQP